MLKSTVASWPLADAEVAVDRSKLKLSVYYLGVPVYHRTVDRPVPIVKGAFTDTFSEKFPAYTPPVRIIATHFTVIYSNPILAYRSVMI